MCSGLRANLPLSRRDEKTMPSYPILTSITFFTPFSAQVFTSESFILREALAMSMVFAPTPWQNWRMPPEEPPEPTTGVLNWEKDLPNSSATMDAKGKTVDEPAI